MASLEGQQERKMLVPQTHPQKEARAVQRVSRQQKSRITLKFHMLMVSLSSISKTVFVMKKRMMMVVIYLILIVIVRMSIR